MSRQKRSRAQARLGNLADGDTASDEIHSDPAPQPKKQKLTVAQNAAAIQDLGVRMSGVDAQLVTQNTQLSSIASMLQQLTAPGQPPHQPTTPAPDTPLPPAQQSRAAGGDQAVAAQPQAFTTPAEGRPPPNTQAASHQSPQQDGAYYAQDVPTYLQQFPVDTNPHDIMTNAPRQPLASHVPAAGTLQRARHHTAGQLNPFPAATTGWPAAIPTLRGAVPPLDPRTTNNLVFAPRPQQSRYEWDTPANVSELGEDPLITKRVAQALQAVANPFTSATGRQSHFPSSFVTRGKKKLPASLGELSIGEYFWGFIQLIRSKEPLDEDIPFMSQHLEKVAEDAKTYAWEGVREWSEEICAQTAKKRLAWSDTYRIDRLQTETSHRTLLAHETLKHDRDRTARDDRVYEIPESVKYGKAAPPCKDYQQGKCTHQACHVSGGYRRLHICNYCLPNKCALLPHPVKDCKTKKFNEGRKGGASPSGFGSN